MVEDEYIIIRPNNDRIITEINKVLSIFFIVFSLLNYMKKDNIYNLDYTCYTLNGKKMGVRCEKK